MTGYKGHDEKRKRIVDGAMNLIFLRGVGGVSVDAIIEDLDISKGTFYHYFKSKGELIEAVVEQMSRLGVEVLEQLAATDRTAVQKMRGYIEASRGTDESIQTIIQLGDALLSPEMVSLRETINHYSIDHGGPILARIIEQGVSELTFSTHHPLETAEIILSAGIRLGERNLREALAEKSYSRQERMDELLRLYETTIERLLDATPGSLTVSLRPPLIPS